MIIPRFSHLSTIGNFVVLFHLFDLFSVIFKLFIKIALSRSNNLVSLLSAILFVRDGFCMKLRKCESFSISPFCTANFTFCTANFTFCTANFTFCTGLELIDVFLANQNEEIVACILLEAVISLFPSSFFRVQFLAFLGGINYCELIVDSRK